MIDDKVDVSSMRRFLVKNEFSGEWKKPPAEIAMAGNLKPEDFSTVFGKKTASNVDGCSASFLVTSIGCLFLSNY